MISIIRTNSQNNDFVSLVKLLDEDLAIRDEEEHSFYDQYNKIATIKNCVVAYNNNKPVGCGAIKLFDPFSIEVKRMYTLPESRGKGIASLILNELEQWAKEIGGKRFILETGKKQPEAIALYKKNGFRLVSNYGQYIGIENSLCFEKHI